MKTLGVLLLLAVGLGAAYWTTQRPGDGLDALRTEARTLGGRLAGAVGALRDGGGDTDNGGGDATVDPAAVTDARSAASSERASAADNVDAAAAAVPAGDVATTASDSSLATNQAANLTDSASAAGMSTDAAALSGRLDALENGLTRTMSVAESSGVQDRLDTLDARLARLDSPGAADRLTGLAERIDTAVVLLNERMDENERAGLALADRDAAERAGLAERLDTIQARLDTLATGAPAMLDADRTDAQGEDGRSPAGTPRGIDAALDARLVALEDALAGSRSAANEVAGLDARLGAVDERLAALSDSDASNAETLSRLEGALESAVSDSRALSIGSAQQEISDALTDLDAEVGDGGATADVGELTESLDATRERVLQLESQLDELPATAEAGQRAQQNQSALQQRIAALERRIVELGERSDPALVSSIDEVREELDEINASGFVTQEELREQREGKYVEYKIYFDKNAAAITDEAARVLDSFIAQETNRTTGVAIFGFTDRQGSAAYNQQLAQRRATTVRSYLIQNGFDFTLIGNVAGLGEDAAAALLEDDQEDAQQRVVVLFASQR